MSINILNETKLKEMKKNLQNEIKELYFDLANLKQSEGVFSEIIKKVTELESLIKEKEEELNELNKKRGSYHIIMRGNSTRTGIKARKVKTLKATLDGFMKAKDYKGTVNGCYNFGGYISVEDENFKEHLLKVYRQTHNHGDLVDYNYFLILKQMLFPFGLERKRSNDSYYIYNYLDKIRFMQNFGQLSSSMGKALEELYMKHNEAIYELELIQERSKNNGHKYVGNDGTKAKKLYSNISKDLSNYLYEDSIIKLYFEHDDEYNRLIIEMKKELEDLSK